MYLRKVNDRVLTLEELQREEGNALGQLLIQSADGMINDSEYESMKYIIENFTTKLMKVMVSHWSDEDE